MFKVPQERLLNVVTSPTVVGLPAAAGSPSIGGFRVHGFGTFLRGELVDKVWKRAGAAATYDKAVFSLSAPPATAKIFRVEVRVAASESQAAEYAVEASLYYGKPFTFEVPCKTAPATAAATATKIVEGYNNYATRFKDSIPFKVTEATGTITIETLNEFLKLVEWKVTAIDPAGVESIIAENAGTKTPGKRGFGDTKWIIANFRAPAPERYLGENTDEAPTPGSLYTQYTWKIRKNRPDLEGHNGVVGGEPTSVVTYVLYVRNDLVTAFETAAFPANPTAGQETGFHQADLSLVS